MAVGLLPRFASSLVAGAAMGPLLTDGISHRIGLENNLEAKIFSSVVSALALGVISACFGTFAAVGVAISATYLLTDKVENFFGNLSDGQANFRQNSEVCSYMVLAGIIGYIAEKAIFGL